MIAVFQLGSHPVWQRQAARVMIAAWLGSSLSGCGQDPLAGGVDLFHNLQGGEIAKQRPPAPGSRDAYPNLATVPARPPAPDIPTEQRLADLLAAERDAAQRAAAASPLVVRTAAAAAAPVKPAQTDPNANHVVVDAAPAPPAPVAPPPVTGIDAVPKVPDAVASGPLPSFAEAAPSPPAGFGISLPPPPAPTPDAAPPAIPAVAANTVAVAFTPGSATLPPSANLNLRRFALAHKGVPLTLTGHGEAASQTPDAQAAALALALHRAEAMAAALAEAGVPASNLRLRADAVGTGGFAAL